MPPRTFLTEADVKAEVKKLLTKHKWFWWCPPANGFGKSGISDFNALRDGVFLGVETKFGSNKPTPAQKAFLQTIMAESAFGFVVSEKTLPDLANWLTHFDASVELAGKEQPVTPELGAAMLDCIAALTAPLATK